MRTLAAIGWGAVIFATSSTVILPHDFFAWLGAHVFRDETNLVRLVSAPPSVISVPVGAEIIDVEVRVRPVEGKPDAIRIEAVANEPSCWRLERLEEAVVVSAPRASVQSSLPAWR